MVAGGYWGAQANIVEEVWRVRNFDITLDRLLSLRCGGGLISNNGLRGTETLLGTCVDDKAAVESMTCLRSKVTFDSTLPDFR
jgi:hypothetical protein